MSASLRILLCRLGCIAFCLVPTTFVGAWSCWRKTTSFAVAQRSDWEQALASRLGLVVEIGAVSYPGLGLARLDDLKLLDPESRQLVASMAVVEVTAHDTGWRVELWQPQVQSATLSPLAQILGDRLLRAAPESLAECEIVCRELTIVRGQTAQSLLAVTARFSPQPAGPELTCEFRLPDAAATAGNIRLVASRNRQQTPPATRWHLDTAGQSLPCELLAELLPDASRLGQNCRFTGAASFIGSGRDWSGEAAGRLAPLDLDALITEQFPHYLSGHATLDVERLAIAGGQLTELRGTLRAQHGTLGPSLLASAQQHLLLTAASRFAERSAAPIPYQQLAFRFELNERSLVLTGDADPTQAGVLVASATGPILYAPTNHTTTAINLLRTLLPESQFQVPATRQTSALVRLFPVPDVAPANTAHTPTRLAPQSAAQRQPAVREPMMR